MFVGHFALGFAAKRAAPRLSLALLFAACQLADILWPVFVATGLDYPDALAWASCGFSNELARTQTQRDLWLWERVDADKLVFRMMRDP